MSIELSSYGKRNCLDTITQLITNTLLSFKAFSQLYPLCMFHNMVLKEQRVASTPQSSLLKLLTGKKDIVLRMTHNS